MVVVRRWKRKIVICCDGGRGWKKDVNGHLVNVGGPGVFRATRVLIARKETSNG